ncbi:MAG: hypothetical protein Q7R22_012115 [Verrucomicrobiota bacterium JB025]|nr:hypothetical protein [Verrucomicrobiota bacterium JB025]
MKLFFLSFAVLLPLQAADDSLTLKVLVPGQEQSLALEPLATIPLNAVGGELRPAAGGRAIVVRTLQPHALHAIRIDEPKALGKIPLENVHSNFAANGDSVFVYRPATKRITRYPLTSIRPAKSTTLKDEVRFAKLLAGPSSSKAPLWVTADQQLHAFNPSTLENAGVHLLKEGVSSTRLPTRSPGPMAVSPDGSVLPCSMNMGRLIDRNLRLAHTLTPGNASHAWLAPDGLHYVHDGQLKSSIEQLPRPAVSNGQGAVAIDRDLWWCTANRGHHRLQLRSGTSDRVLLEVQTAGRSFGRVFISFTHNRLACTDAKTKSVHIYPFDLEAFAKKLDLPTWIETNGSLLVPHLKPAVFKLSSNGEVSKMSLSSHPEGADLKDGVIRWTPPEVTKAAPFRFTVEIPNETIRSFTVFVVPDCQ